MIGGSGTGAIEHLGRADCLALLKTVTIGRVAITIDALPVILPVHFGVVNERVVLKTAVGSKLDAGLRNAVIAFNADQYLPDESGGWSVLARGQATEVTDPDEFLAIQALDLPSWSADGSPERWLSVDPVLLNGVLFRRRP